MELSSLTFEREFEELMLEHARVMASMAEALAKYAETAGDDSLWRERLVERYEDAENTRRARFTKCLRMR